MGKYLPGLSYGMSGGPRPLSWGPATPSQAWIDENESGPGKYTIRFSWRRKIIDQVTFWACSLRAAQSQATSMTVKLESDDPYLTGIVSNELVRYEGEVPGNSY